MKTLLLLTALVTAALAQAQEIRRTHDPVAIARPALIVTHASGVFTKEVDVILGINDLVRSAKASGRPVVYLMADDDIEDTNWFLQDRRPDYAIPSGNGDHDISIRTDEVTVTGGYFSLCLDRTVDAILRSAEKNGLKKLTVRLPLDGIYEDKALFMATGKRTYEETEFFFSVTDAMPLRYYLSYIREKSFLEGIRFVFEQKSGFTFEVRLGKKTVLKKKSKGKLKVIFQLV